MSTEFDPTFNIMINTEKGEDELCSLLLASLPSVDRKGGYLTCGKNVLDLHKNSLAAKEKTNSLDGWLYYAYELSVFPSKAEVVDSTEQLLFAKQLVAIFEEKGHICELVAEFE